MNDFAWLFVPALLGIWAAIALVAPWASRKDEDRRRGQERAQRAAAQAYQAALATLVRDPADVAARARVLEAGHRFYSYEIPDMGECIISSAGIPYETDPKDNSPAREAKIAADIEGRVGQLNAPA